MVPRMSQAGRKPHSFLVTLCSLALVNTPCASTGKHKSQTLTQHPSHFRKMKLHTTSLGDLQLMSPWMQGGAKAGVELPGVPQSGALEEMNTEMVPNPAAKPGGNTKRPRISPG